ncbi:hypothetical protein [Pinibacter aurantiacus]|uniref:Uncharacterized protein n=1 Tax=Pinibacter aurantiacus TaxID=2851599 RepID=A0A9E2S961_9BACT|nr:hypothetical protein [Pinibacter aurantiacus]MBV4355645.1 hypothetical protein [Pinibacter aurantiacus]
MTTITLRPQNDYKVIPAWKLVSKLVMLASVLMAFSYCVLLSAHGVANLVH